MPEVEWKAAGSKLAFKAFVFQHGADMTEEIGILIYDVVRRQMFKPDVNRILSGQMGRRCDLWIDVRGFSPAGQLVLDLKDIVFSKEYFPPLEKRPLPCISGRKSWLLDWESDQLIPVTTDTTI